MRRLSLVVTLLTVSTFVNANSCDFKSIDGLEFEVNSLNSLNKFNNKNINVKNDSYEFLSFPDDELTPITESFAYGRNIKITDPNKFYYIEALNKNNKNKVVKTRVYSAMMDNCKEIRIKVPENHPYFSDFFNTYNHELDGSFSFISKQSELGLIYLDDLRQAEEAYLKGKPFYVLNSQFDDMKALPLSKPSLFASLDTLTPYHIKSIDYDYVFVPGYRSGQFSLIVDINGLDVRVPFVKDRITFVNPLKSKFVRARFLPHIKTGSIDYGMNTYEVALALGKPSYIREHHIYKNSNFGGEYEKNDFFPYGGLDKDYPFALTEKSGFNQAWFYENKFTKDKSIKFDESGVLVEGLQNFYKNEPFNKFESLVGDY